MICPILNKPCIKDECEWWVTKLSRPLLRPGSNPLDDDAWTALKSEGCAISLLAGATPEVSQLGEEPGGKS